MERVREIIRDADPKIRPFLTAARAAAAAQDGPGTWENVSRAGQAAYRSIPKDLGWVFNPPIPEDPPEVTAARPHVQAFLDAMQFEKASIRDMLRRGSWGEVVKAIDQMEAYLDRYKKLDAAANAARVSGLSKSGLGVDPYLQATITGYLTGETGLVPEQKEKAKAKAGRRKTRTGKGKRKSKRTRKH